jgi:nitroimidazol reductase NimA-like FMN-containing flavoprotein (pyridoxamine 5'-phosphate oxidase superfamily)
MRKIEREVSEITEIESIIAGSDVCRIAFAENNIPYIVTMNFGYTAESGRRLYFHCANEGRKIDMIRKNPNVCFEMDCDHELTEGKLACDFSMKYRSIVGYGTISIVHDKNEKITGFNTIMSHYVIGTKFDYDIRMVEKTTILKLDILEITGKKC